MKDFSVVIPVRGNIEGLKITLGAFELFTAHKEKIEVILVADRCDPDLYRYNALRSVFGYTFDISVYSVDRSDHFVRDYYNFGVNKSIGKNVMVFNDDCYVQTNNWDNIVRDKIGQAKDLNGVYLVDIWDSTHQDENCSFPRFPMISRKAIDTVGYFFHPLVRMWPADRIIWELYNNSRAVIQCYEVKLQHDHVSNGDPSKSRLLKIFNEDKANGVFPVNVLEDQKKLMEAIKCGN